MKMKFSTREEFVRFMYANKVEHGSVQSISDGFKELYNGVPPFPENSLSAIADLTTKMIINNDWTTLINADKSFFEKNGYIEVEYNETTNNVTIAKRQKGRPTSKNSASKNTSVRLTDEKLNQIDTYCKNHNIDNRSQFIKIAIDALLNDSSSSK